MAKKSARLSYSRHLFPFVIIASLAIALLVITAAVMKPTNTNSHASVTREHVNVSVRYDNGNKCYEGPVKILYDSSDSPKFESSTFTSKSNNCTFKIPFSGIYIILDTPKSSDLVSFNITDDTGIRTINVTGLTGAKAKVNPSPNGSSKIDYFVKGKPKATDPQPVKNPDCGPVINYGDADGGDKSVTYSFSIRNTCKDTKKYFIWTSVDMGKTSGWTWKFANGDKSVTKTIEGKDSKGAQVEVSRKGVNRLPQGKSYYKVTFHAAQCKNPDNCNSISDTNDNRDTYTTTYTVEN